MNLSLFAHRRFAMGSIVAFIYGIALFGSTYLLPVYMQMGLGLSPSYVGSILLPAGLVITFEQAARYLTDHLRGDVYYRTERPGHNLDRCRNQLRLLSSLIARRGELAAALP